MISLAAHYLKMKDNKTKVMKRWIKPKLY